MSAGPSRSQREVYHFGDFTLDAEARLLTCEDSAIPLTPKAFDILWVLVQNAGRAVTRAELLERVWPDAVVEAGNLDWNVSAVRKALGEPEGKAIETVRGFGYRFTLPVHRERVRTGPVSSIAMRPADVEAMLKASGVPSRRASMVAVLPFDDLARDPSTAWVSSALSEMVGAELTGPLYAELVPREILATTLTELGLGLARSLSEASLARLRERLSADLVVSGSFLVAGPDRRLRVDATLQDCRSGRTVESYQEKGTLDTIIEVGTNLGQRVLQRLRSS